MPLGRGTKRKSKSTPEVEEVAGKDEITASSAGVRSARKKAPKGGKKESPVDPTSVFIRGLPSNTTETDLRSLLDARVGPTVTCFPIRDDYGLAKFKDEADAKICMEQMQGLEFQGAKLCFETAKKRTYDNAGKTNSSGSGSAPGGANAELKVVQIQGIPSNTEKDCVQKWVEDHLPGGCGIEEVRRISTKNTNTGDKVDVTFTVSFKKEANARRAVEVLGKEKFGGHALSANFQALERSKNTAKAGRLIVRNLNFSATEKQLRKVFQTVGELIEVHVPMKPGSSTLTRGFAFLQYKDPANAQRAISELNGAKVCGRGVAVDWSIDSKFYGVLQRQDEIAQQKASKAELGDGGKKKKNARRKTDNEVVEDQDVDTENEDDEENDEEAVPKKKKKRTAKDAQDELKRMKELLDEDEMVDSEDEDKTKNDDDDQESEEEEYIDEETGKPLRKPGYDINDGKTLFIRNIPFDAEEKDLRGILAQFGPLQYVKLVNDPSGKNPHSGKAFAKFYQAEAFEAALAAEKAADKKLKEMSVVTRKTDRRELPVVDGFGVCLKGRRLVLKEAVAPEKVRDMLEENKPKKGDKRKERNQWLHLLHVGAIREGTPEWDKLSPSEKRQRKASAKERKFRINNSNFALNPLRLSVRNLPTHIGASDLRDAVVNFMVSKADDGNTSKTDRQMQAQKELMAAKVSRDGERRDANNERRSRGFGFLSFSNNLTAVRVLEHMNNNPTVFGGQRRPIVDFAIEDKRKLRMQDDLYRKHAHKVLPSKADVAKTANKDVGGSNAGDAVEDEAEDKEATDAARIIAKTKKNRKPNKAGERGRRQRDKRREEKMKKAERDAIKEVLTEKRKKAKASQRVEEAIERKAKKTKGFKHIPDAGLPSAKRQRKETPQPKKVVGHMADDFELKAMERFRQAGF